MFKTIKKLFGFNTLSNEEKFMQSLKTEAITQAWEASAQKSQMTALFFRHIFRSGLRPIIFASEHRGKCFMPTKMEDMYLLLINGGDLTVHLRDRRNALIGSLVINVHELPDDLFVDTANNHNIQRLIKNSQRDFDPNPWGGPRHRLVHEFDLISKSLKMLKHHVRG